MVTTRFPSPTVNRSYPTAHTIDSSGRRQAIPRAVAVPENGAPAAAPKRSFFQRLFGPRDPSAARTEQPRNAPSGAGPGAPKPINQLDHPNAQLGNGKYTIAQSGCFLSSITMASNKLHPGQNLGVLDANTKVKAGNGFSGSGLEMARAAPALGMDMTSRRALGGINDATVLNRLDQHLAAGKPAVAGVDFRPGRSSGHSDADHFITIYGKRGNDYLAMDPAGGRPVTITKGADGRLSYRGADDYKLSEVLLLDKR